MIRIQLLAAALAAAAASGALDLKRPTADAGISVLSAIAGGEALEWAGTRLAGGDLNGDGIADLVIAAPGGSEDRPSRRGRLYVVFGGVAPPRPALDLTLRRAPGSPPGAPPALATDAGLIVEGWDDFDHLGAALAVADLDLDGFADIIAGAPRADGPGDARPDCGEVYVIRGAAALPRILRLGDHEAAGLRVDVLIGRSRGDSFGSALAVGDVDSDGRPDLIVGAPLADGAAGALGALDVGEAIVLFGGGRLSGSVDLARPAAAGALALLRGADAGDQAGSAVAAGDFDGDGTADVAVGARGGDGPSNGRPDSGEVYLVLGSRHLPPAISLGKDAAAFVASPGIGDLAGGSLALGDVDGDGRADLAIGAESADGRRDALLDAGEVQILLGRSRQEFESLRPAAAGPPRRPAAAQPTAPDGPVLIDLASAAVTGVTVVHGADPGDHTGVRTLADLDGDGLAEIVIGAEDAASRRNARAGGGEVRILPGGRRPPAAVSLRDASGVTIHGPVGGAHLGKAALALDVNGDGRPELIVSAPQAGRSLAGRVWILGAAWKDLLRPAGPVK